MIALGLLACGAADAGRSPGSLGSLEWVEAGDPALPLIVMVHGYGDRPESMLSLVQSCGLEARIVAPRGPQPYPSGEGWSWFTVTSTGRDLEGVGVATDQLAALIRGLRERDHPSKVVLSGFSQGGILSFALATRYPELVDAAVPVSGAVLLPPTDPPAHPPPIRALHGEADERLPFADVRAGVDRLKALGWDATLEAFPGVGHEIPPDVRGALCRELGQAIRVGAQEPGSGALRP